MFGEKTPDNFQNKEAECQPLFGKSQKIHPNRRVQASPYVARYKANVFFVFYVFLCFFQVKKLKKSKKGYCMIFASRRAEAYATFLVTTHRDCIRHTMCFCVFVFFLSLFFSNSTAPESRCVFVFFNKKHKNTRTKFLVVFFSAVELNQRANVFLCFCVFFFFQKTQKHNDQIFKVFFISNSTAPESRRVFVFLCFLTKNTKTQGKNLWLCFFQQ